VNIDITHVPSVKELHPAANGDGLLLRGYAAAFSKDRIGDEFSKQSLEVAARKYMATNPVLLYLHKMGSAPIGRVLKATVDNKGLFIEAVMPKPPATSTSALEIWHAAKEQLLRAFSVGGVWTRVGSKIVAADLREISLVPIGVNFDTYATSAAPTEVKCLTNGSYVRTADYAEYKALTNELENLQIDRVQQKLALAQLQMLAYETQQLSRR
jgi:hypothetical protein